MLYIYLFCKPRQNLWLYFHPFHQQFHSTHLCIFNFLYKNTSVSDPGLEVKTLSALKQKMYVDVSEKENYPPTAKLKQGKTLQRDKKSLVSRKMLKKKRENLWLVNVDDQLYAIFSPAV